MGLFYTQIVLYRGLPFKVEIPNAATIKAIRNADAEIVARYGIVSELIKKIGI